MRYLLTRGRVFTEDGWAERDVFVSEGNITAIEHNLSVPAGVKIINAQGRYIFPGFIEVHAHFREPGFSYKESMASGTAAAARGGYTTVCTMPNLDPVPDSIEHLQPQLDAITRDAVVRVRPYGAITRGQQGTALSDMAALADRVVAFSDDGRGVQDAAMMEAAMRQAKALGKLIVAHCEDERLLHGGCIHDGAYAAAHGLPGISSESEWRQLERDLRLVAQTGCAYHVCHVSTKESVALLREAKLAGLDVTAETAPHYLTLCEDDLRDDGRFRMNPPLRAAADRDALRQGICDGTLDMVATDHAPHSAEEKSRGLRRSPNGVIGVETAFPVLYTQLVQTGVITLAKLIDLLWGAPHRRFGLGNALAVGQAADLTMFDVEREYVIDPEQFLSAARSTPFAGWSVRGECLLTLVNGKIAWQSERLDEQGGIV